LTALLFERHAAFERSHIRQAIANQESREMADHASAPPLLWWQDSDYGVSSNSLLEALVLGHICKGARALLDMSQNDLAEIADVSRRTIINIESGQITPDARTVIQIKDALRTKGVQVDLRSRRLALSLPLISVSSEVDQYVCSRSEITVGQTKDDQVLASMDALRRFIASMTATDGKFKEMVSDENFIEKRRVAR
jgi:DNA-binding XRE family transcriptional regulator